MSQIQDGEREADLSANSLREIRARAEAVVEQRWSRSKTQLARDVVALTDSVARLVVERDAAERALEAAERKMAGCPVCAQFCPGPSWRKV